MSDTHRPDQEPHAPDDGQMRVTDTVFTARAERKHATGAE